MNPFVRFEYVESSSCSQPITLGINGAVHFSMAKKTWLEQLDELLADNIKDPNLTNADLAEKLLMSKRAFYR
ncbi:MAG: hypothetical protein AB8G22_26015, partial [Saprospiraceae bacterium]